MSAGNKRQLVCAVYTRKSSEEGLEQEFNSLDAQREACEAFITSQRHEGWKLRVNRYDDGGFSGGNMDRPGLVKLLADISDRKVDVVVVYKVDRLTRSLSDFAKIVETFDGHGVSFVSVTQQFNTTTSMGRLTLNVLLSFAQFEREVTGERIRDKIAASRRKGMWMGGTVPLGYDLEDQRYVINSEEAKVVRTVFKLYVELVCVRRLQVELKARGLKTKVRKYKSGKTVGGVNFSRGHLYYMLNNRTYLGEAVHKGSAHPGLHEPIIDQNLWDRVQATLNGNATDRKNGVGAKEPSLLAGILFDDRGNVLTPSHTSRRGIRYRYYVSQAVLQNRDDKAGHIKRMPAEQIESLVIDQIEKLLADPVRVAAELKTPNENENPKLSEVVDATDKLRNRFAKAVSARKREILLQITRKVVVGSESVAIAIDKNGLIAALGLAKGRTTNSSNAVDENSKLSRDMTQFFEIRVAARLKRSGREQRLLIGEMNYAAVSKKADPGLIKTVMRAHKWNAQFVTGTSTDEIAKVEGVHRGYVAAVIPLAFLPPKLTEAILEGRQPPKLTAKKLISCSAAIWMQATAR
ncbi:MAG: recombinase family protein [Rhodobacteraceae bacterium]|nr:recombinase family protein [Paracoccaceae bacterium]